jgi:hypothetical protein
VESGRVALARAGPQDVYDQTPPPRIEELFARIQRWRNGKTGEIYWRAITKDNITSICGDPDNSGEAITITATSSSYPTWAAAK